MSTVAAVPPTFTVCAGIVPTVTRARWVGGDTMTKNIWVAVELLGSVAVTLIVDAPTATPVMLTVEPDTLTVALVVSDELAV